ncbi:hypothetical protein AGMMS49928_07160 [Spirochaetia bacterium]|nr:hypothetical protein AGMMS49928_07160 [Spirochaetia bacterium]
MSIYDIFRYGHGIFFVTLQAALMAGVFLEWLKDRRACRLASDVLGQTMPKVSVVIPVHNEAARIEGLLQSLALQDYGSVEFIFIDDRSTDSSPDLLQAFAEKRPETRIIRLEENPGPNHKQYALGRGISASSGSLLLFTDADCEVPPSWVSSMALRMADEKVGALIAPVFKKRAGPGFFHLYQCYDHIVRYIYLAGAVGLGAGGGGFGNNLMLRRESLEKIGGYDAVPPSPTEDAALVSELRARKVCKIRAAAGADVFVKTGAENSWKDFISQTLRWNNGGVFSPDVGTRINFNLLMLVISTGILAIPLLPFFPGLWPMPLGVFIVMLMNTAAALGPFRSGLPRAGAAYIIQLLFTPVYFTFLTILGYCRVKVKWKGSAVSGISHRAR